MTRPWWRDGWLQFYAAILVITFGAGLVASTGRLGGLVQPPSIGEQIEEVKREALDVPGGRHLVVDERVRFHGGETDPWVLVIQAGRTHDEFDKAARKDKRKPPPSDELRVYDVQDGRLKLKLRFQPKPVNGHAAAWRTIPGAAAFATDYDEDGAPEVIAGYEIPAEKESAVVPFALAWGGSGYRLVPLTPGPPRLSHEGLDREAVGYRKGAYAQRQFEDGGLTLKGYRVQSFALADKPAARLLTGYFTESPKATRVMELHASQFRKSTLEPQPCTPDYPYCPAPKRLQEIAVPPDQGLDKSLVTAWQKVGRKWSRKVRVEESNRPASPSATNELLLGDLPVTAVEVVLGLTLRPTSHP